MKIQLINKLLWKYTNLLKEIRHQKNLFKNEVEYYKLVCKISGYINLIQNIQLHEQTK